MPQTYFDRNHKARNFMFSLDGINPIAPRVPKNAQHMLPESPKNAQTLYMVVIVKLCRESSFFFRNIKRHICSSISCTSMKRFITI